MATDIEISVTTTAKSATEAHALADFYVRDVIRASGEATLPSRMSWTKAQRTCTSLPSPRLHGSSLPFRLQGTGLGTASCSEQVLHRLW